MSKDKTALNGKTGGTAGAPPKHIQLQNRLTRAAKKAAELRLDMFEKLNDEIEAAIKIMIDFPLGRCNAEVTQAHYRAAKDLYEEWCKSCDRGEAQLDFLEKRDKDTGDLPEGTPANVQALFSKKAK